MTITVGDSTEREEIRRETPPSSDSVSNSGEEIVVSSLLTSYSPVGEKKGFDDLGFKDNSVEVWDLGECDLGKKIFEENSMMVINCGDSLSVDENLECLVEGFKGGLSTVAETQLMEIDNTEILEGNSEESMKIGENGRRNLGLDEEIDGLGGYDEGKKCRLQIDSLAPSTHGDGCGKENSAKTGKLSRRKRKALSKGLAMKLDDNVGNESYNKTGDETKRFYSRKFMMDMRFVNLEEQRKKWYEVYCGLGPAVTKEYDQLNSANQKHKISDSGTGCRIGKKDEGMQPAIYGDGFSQEVDNLVEDINLEEECGEGDESDEEYESILRPAFYIEGEPNFDLGPPEDGLEYLRRVRWEASRIPKVKIAKLDKSKLGKEQTDYMPKIPEIAKCPENLLPSQEWEDVFLAEFLELRLTLSRLEEHSDLGSTVAISSGEGPTLSAILAMDSVARASMLRKCISSLEAVSTFSRSDCMWLYALCAAVDTPFNADTSASMRCLLRKCASLRAQKSEMDDEVVMLNMLATISGKYFKQSEN